MPRNKTFVSRDEAARKLSLSVRTIDRMVSDGTLKSKLFRGVRSIYMSSVTMFKRRRDT